MFLPHFNKWIYTRSLLSFVLYVPWQRISCTSIKMCGPGSGVGIATGYGLDGPGIESRWGRDFPHLSRPALGPTQPPAQWVPGLSGGKERPGRDADHSPPSSAVVKKGWGYNSTPPMGRTACTEPQCLHKGCSLPLPSKRAQVFM